MVEFKGPKIQYPDNDDPEYFTRMEVTSAKTHILHHDNHSTSGNSDSDVPFPPSSAVPSEPSSVVPSEPSSALPSELSSAVAPESEPPSAVASEPDLLSPPKA